MLGNDAAMAGGAVTATTTDASAIWYNPAGLANVNRQVVDVSASALGVRHYSTPSLIVAEQQRAPGNIVEFVGVPSVLGYVRAISPQLSFGFGLFVPKFQDFILRSALDAGDGRLQVTIATAERTYYGGPSLGLEILPNLRFGASWLVSYRFLQVGSEFSGGVPEQTPEPSFVQEASLFTESALGTLLHLGVQWDVLRSWSLGVALRSPEYRVYRNRSASGVLSASTADGALFLPLEDDRSGAGFDRVRPLSLRLGTAYRFESGWLSCGADFSPALDEAEVQRRQLINARLGVIQHVTPGLRLGAGVFSDRDPARRPNAFGQRQVHFYGGTLGARWGTSYKLEPHQEADTLGFDTVLALRYAFGRGRIGGLATGPLDSVSPDTPLDVQRAPLRVHELALHIGSAFYF